MAVASNVAIEKRRKRANDSARSLGEDVSDLVCVFGTALAALMKLPTADRLRFFQDGLARIADSGENEIEQYFLT